MVQYPQDLDSRVDVLLGGEAGPMESTANLISSSVVAAATQNSTLAAPVVLS